MKNYVREALGTGYFGIRILFPAVLSLLALFILSACSPKKLGGGNGVGLNGGGSYRPVRPVLPKNSVLATVRENLPPGTLYVPPEFENAQGTPLADYLAHSISAGRNLDLALEPGVREVMSDQQKTATLNLYFAIDVSASMEINIDAVKSNVSDLVSKLKNKGFNPKVGLVTFRDEIVEKFRATEDVNAFLDVLNRQFTIGAKRINLWEASLLGIKEAAVLLNQNFQPGDSNAIVVVSDNPGHFGYESCSIDPLVQTLNSFSSEFQKSLRIYGSVRGDTSGEEYRQCDLSSGNGLAKDQFEDLLRSSLLSSEASKRGGVLDFPLSSDVILGQLVRIIERTVPGQRNVCLSKSFSIYDGNQMVSSWSGKPLSETYGTFTLGEPIMWKNAIPQEKIQSLRGKYLRGQVERCCISEDLAVIGNFSSCQNKSLQFDFSIEK